MEILDEAVARPASERSAYLTEACAGNPALRAEVESLLAASDQAGAFLEPLRPAAAPGPHTTMAGGAFGHYHIGERLGEGGMGVVYAAHDQRLDRAVALKVVARSFAEDPDRRARFEREARALAAVNHPHIAAVYGLEPVGPGGEPVIVMEYVPGRTLAELLEEGPLDWPEAARLAAQIADALEAAHASGIVHRDLKPANVRVTPEGRAKVLDFGLAKDVVRPTPPPRGRGPGGAFVTPHDTPAATPQRPHTPLSPSTPPPISPSPPPSPLSPTPGPLMTIEGALMGTPAYMSPEQTRGRVVDRRTDIWALGCVLFEMLAGRRAFAGATPAETMHAILRTEPDYAALPAPPALVRLIQRCLQKDPDRRLRDAGDARLELEDPALGAEPGAPPVRPRRAAALVLAAALVAAGFSALTTIALRGSAPAAPTTASRFAIDLPEGTRLSASSPQIAISPDGHTIAFVADGDPGKRGLYLRRTDEFHPRLVPNTADANYPYFSRDGRWVIYTVTNGQQKLPAEGGPPVPIPGSYGGYAGVLLKDGTAVVSSWDSGAFVARRPGDAKWAPLKGIPADGLARYVTGVLPDDRTLLLTACPGSPEQSSTRVEAFNPDTRELRTLIAGAAGARYLDSGHLVYTQEGKLLGVRFDPRTLAVRGESLVLLDNVTTFGYRWPMLGDISPTGTLVYVAGPVRTEASQLCWIHRDGRTELIREDPAGFQLPRISPDGRTAVAARMGRTNDLALVDLTNAGATPQQITKGLRCMYSFWSPDGRSIAVVEIENDGYYVSVVPANTDAPPRRLRRVRAGAFPRLWGWTADGQWISLREEWVGEDGAQGSQLLLVPAAGGEPRRLALPEQDILAAVFSPDGRWLTYSTGDSGIQEVYLRSWPDLGPRRKVSVSGGYRPVWRPDSRELFYQWNGAMYSVPVEPSENNPADIALGEPVRVFNNFVDDRYDVDAAGERILICLHKGVTDTVTRLHVVENWGAELRRRLP